MDVLGSMWRHERQSHFPSLTNVGDDSLRRRESQPISDEAIRGHRCSRLGHVMGQKMWLMLMGKDLAAQGFIAEALLPVS